MYPIIEEIQEAITSIVDSDVEYTEEHTDAGDGYNHLPREGGWCYHNCDDKLKASIEANSICTYDLDEDILAEIALENFEMVSEHTLSSTKDHILYIDSYPIQEIETQIEYSIIERITGRKLTEKRMHILTNGNSREHCINNIDNNSFCIYSCSDIAWSAQITADDFQELVNDRVGPTVVGVKTIKDLFKLIDLNLFFINPTLDYEEITDSIIKLMDVLQETETDESIWSLGECGSCTLDDLIAGAYWHYTEWHDGQASVGYKALSALGQIFNPGMSTPDKDNIAYQMLNELGTKYYSEIDLEDVRNWV